MKKLILLALAAVIMAGCIKNAEEKVVEGGFSCLTVDSCEYIIGAYRLTHKGNCKFCKERRQKELEALVEQLKK